LKKMSTIAEILEDDRPREKLEKLGAQNLTDAELLAIVLSSSGQKGKSVLQLSAEILRGANKKFRNLARTEFADFLKIRGIGKAKASLLSAVFEIAARHESETAEDFDFKSPEKIARHFLPIFRHRKKEIFSVLLFDTKFKFLKRETVATGSLAKISLSAREVFAPAISSAAASIIILHNHPSGDPAPSLADEKLTEKLCEIGKTLEVKVLDHLILGRDDFFSFAQNGKIFP